MERTKGMTPTSTSWRDQVSINRNQLTAEDVGYALNFCLSPLMLYLVAASFADISGVKTDLFKRMTTHRRIIHALLMLSLFFGLALTITTVKPSRAFKDSDRAHNVHIYISDTFFPPWYIIYPVFGSLFSICVYRRRPKVMADVRAYRKGGSDTWWRLRAAFIFVKCACCVCVIAVRWFVEFDSII